MSQKANILIETQQTNDTAKIAGDVLAKLPLLAEMITQPEQCKIIESGHEDWKQAQLVAIRDMQRQLLMFFKPILTIDEAAELIGVTPKRFTNIIYEEKARLGHIPDFVCDAGGVIRQRILRDPLFDWIKRRRRRGGQVRHSGKLIV